MRVEPLSMGLVPLYEETPEKPSLSLSPPCEDTARMQTSAIQGVGPHQTSNLLAP